MRGVDIGCGGEAVSRLCLEDVNFSCCGAQHTQHAQHAQHTHDSSMQYGGWLL